MCTYTIVVLLLENLNNYQVHAGMLPNVVVQQSSSRHSAGSNSLQTSVLANVQRRDSSIIAQSSRISRTWNAPQALFGKSSIISWFINLIFKSGTATIETILIRHKFFKPFPKVILEQPSR
jgi:hypothetical protein